MSTADPTELVDALVRLGLEPVAERKKGAVRVCVGSGIEVVLTTREHEGRQVVTCSSLLGSRCRVDTARLRRVLAGKEGIIGTRLALRSPNELWATIDVDRVDCIWLRYALWAVTNTVCGWQHLAVDHLQAVPPEPSGPDRPISIEWSANCMLTPNPAALGKLLVRELLSVGHNMRSVGSSCRLFEHDEHPVSVTMVDDGCSVDVSVFVAAPADPYSAGLGQLLRRNDELRFARIGLDELAGNVSVMRTLLAPDLAVSGALGTAVATLRSVAERLRDETVVLGASLAQYRTQDPQDRIELLRAVIAASQEWAWRSDGRVADAAATTLAAAANELDLLEAAI